ncbi:MAG: ABC transporter permease [Oscillospiraceae bacterium]|nr:ABC transporter permease [Oscillospiraceae bacterium]
MAQEPERLKTVIAAGGKNLQYWKDLWRYRGLAWHMARRDFTVRYKQTAIGLAWSLVNPFINMLLLSFVFGSLAGFGEHTDIPYYICVYAGILPWTLFARSFTVAAGTFQSGAELMKKVYFPRLTAPLSSMLSSIAETLISYLMLFLLMGVLRYTPPARILLSFPLMLPVALLGTFLGLFVASFSIRYRDIVHMVPFLMQMGQYLSPVAFTLEDMRGKLGESSLLFHILYYANPVSGFLTTFKWLILRDQSFRLDWRALAIGFVWLAGSAVLGILRFRKAERTFVDIV